MLTEFNHKAILLSIVMISCVGCGGGSDKLELYPVTGKVTKGGQPAEGIILTLFSKTGGAPGLMAVSGADGTFEVAMGNGDKGAPVGTYAVVLSDSQTAEIDYSNPGAAPPQSDRIPKVYTEQSTTDLKLEVTADGENIFDIELDR